MIFDYPDSREERVHGPAGYRAYEPYRPWLRDEFKFRCVYCLKRETWGQATLEFELDHFEPQSLVPQRSADYFNLVYACRRCNLAKLDQVVRCPLELLTNEMATVLPDGILVSSNLETLRLVHQLDLNSPRLQRWRVMWMRIVDLAYENEPSLARELTRFPPDLPNLRRLRPPKNSRPDGLNESWFARSQRGELPDSY